ncbi:MAG TPA: hypothetical protein VGB17_15570 [Pyrinomonadaceae bacterium]|jgi:hypothetical protein
MSEAKTVGLTTEQAVREKTLELLTDLIASGTVEAGYHKACEHPGTVRAQAECNLRHEEFRKQQEQANRPSAVCGRYGVYAHRCDQEQPGGAVKYGVTAVRREPKVNGRVAKRLRQQARKQAAETHG